jgi:hypothetical protein
MQTKHLHSLSDHRNRVVKQYIINSHLLEVLNGKITVQNFNLGKPPPTPPPSLPHMPAIAGAYPLDALQVALCTVIHLLMIH